MEQIFYVKNIEENLYSKKIYTQKRNKLKVSCGKTESEANKKEAKNT